MSTKQKNRKGLPYPKVLAVFKPYLWVFGVMLLFGLYSGLVDICLPLFQKYAIENFIKPGTVQGLGLFCICYALFFLSRVISDFISSFQTARVEALIARDMRGKCFKHMQSLSFSFFNQNSVGYLHSRIMSDTSRIGGVIAWDFMSGIWNLSYLIGAAVVMLILDWKLAICVMVIVPVLALGAALFEKRLRGLNKEVRELNSQISGKFNESITGSRTVRVLGAEEKMKSGFFALTDKMKRTAVLTAKVRASFICLIAFSTSLALALVLWRGGVIAQGDLEYIAKLSVFMTYAMNMMEQVQWVVNALADMIFVRVNMERVSKILETKSDVPDSPEVVERYGDTFNPKKENWEPLHGDITFEDVSFMYPDGNEWVLEHFDLHVPKGTNVAIVGETGAGKSTLVNLVCRFYDPTKGRVLIDGRDAKERSQLWLHSSLGYVLQTPHLFSGSVAENLRYGNPNATEEEMEAVLREIDAWRIVERMGKGLASDVGEGGDLLSTGEKQLLSFARVMLANPSILVLDEATSSVDSHTEQLIQKATERVSKGRTCFMIAHRLSTIRSADIILAVKDGKIIERGSHAELMAEKGYYYRLYTRQYEDEQTSIVLDKKE
ncbi:MAG: ABC transporter ATP-binding protein [Clostridia bacterium]|nr:ABC transporter ATP-binding protein [Clostridia bacterium]